MLARTGDLQAHDAAHELAQAHRRHALVICEIDQHSPASWYLVRVVPGRDMQALRWLAARGFGAFRPMMRSPKSEIMAPVFPGWLFVFVWNIGRMQHAVALCPEISGFLLNADHQRPAIISDDFVSRMRTLAWVETETNAHRLRYERQKKKPAKLQKRQRQALRKLKETVKKTAHWDESMWEQANSLAPHERIALLQQAVANCAARPG